jgi:hypothetical protein
MPPEALLAIRSDIVSSVEPEYLEWLTKEHTIERVSIDGFVSARIFRAKYPDFGRYLILYELADTAVVDSAAYLERLNNPTSWSTRMMPHLGNFVRGGGRIVTVMGAGYGTTLVPIMRRNEFRADENQALERISKAPSVVAIRVLQTDSKRTTAASNERNLRSGDQSFETLLMIETFDEGTAKSVIQQLPPKLLELWQRESGSQELPAYSQLFYLGKPDRSCIDLAGEEAPKEEPSAAARSSFSGAALLRDRSTTLSADFPKK